MYEIDLLKGEGVPIRSRPGGIAFACLVIAVPLIAGIAMASIYLEHRVAVSVQSQQLTRLRRATTALSGALETKRSLEDQKTLGAHLLGDVKTALTRHTQWSDTLTTVIECLPEALILTRLGATRNIMRRQIPSRENPDVMITSNVPARALQIRVAGRNEDTAYRAVREFQDRLRASATLASRIDTMTVSQESELLNGESVVSYELICAFKPSLE
jgi:hypothetical protein